MGVPGLLHLGEHLHFVGFGVKQVRSPVNVVQLEIDPARQDVQVCLANSCELREIRQLQFLGMLACDQHWQSSLAYCQYLLPCIHCSRNVPTCESVLLNFAQQHAAGP